MINNIEKYLSLYHNKSFDEVPLNEADLVCGAIISYADFDGNKRFKKYHLENSVVPFTTFHTKKDFDLFAAKCIDPASMRNFLKVFFKSKRYRNIRFGFVENIYDNKNATQFFAFAGFAKKYTVIFFRGTDTTIIGWKEDLDIASKDKIPSQILAKKYLYKIAAISNRPIIIVGHSKGGNLGYYAFLSASKEIKNKVVRVYNFDGPGFNNEKFKPDEYKDKLKKFVPSSSIVGMLLEKTTNYEIVKSSKRNIDAHDLLTWEFSKESRYTKLVRLKSLSKYSFALKIAILEWYNKYTKKDFKDIADFMYGIAMSNKQVTILNLKLDVIKQRKVYLHSIQNYNKKKKEKLKIMSRDFVKSYFYILFHIKEYDVETLKLMTNQE